jgi:hypothetical protein
VSQPRASQHRVPTRVASRAPLTAVPRGFQVFAMAAPMAALIPEASVFAVPAVTVEPMAVQMAALTGEPMAVQMAALTGEPMAEPTVGPMAEPTVGLTGEPTAAQTVGRGDA